MFTSCQLQCLKTTNLHPPRAGISQLTAPLLAGLQGTAATEAAELFDVYGLSVVEVPTNKPSRRQHMGRLLFLDQKEKYVRLLHEVRPCRGP